MEEEERKVNLVSYSGRKKSICSMEIEKGKEKPTSQGEKGKRHTLVIVFLYLQEVLIIEICLIKKS